MSRLRLAALSLLAVAGISAVALSSGVIKPNGDSTPADPTSGGTPTFVFADEFDGPAGSAPSSSLWIASNYCDRWGSLSCNTSRSQNVSLDGAGHLRITALRERYTDPHGARGTYTSARIRSKIKFRYGRVLARVRMPADKGLFPSVWGRTDRRSDGVFGEYDITEVLGHAPNRSYCSSHSWGGSNQRLAGLTASTIGSRLASGFHTYELDWTPDAITYRLDDRLCATHTRSQVQPWPFDSTPGDIMLGMAVGGSWPGSPDSTTTFPATMLVDSVHVYARSARTEPHSS